MKPFEGNGEDNGATASDYQDGVNHEKAVMGRLDFDYIYVLAESLDEFAEKLVAHQRTLAAGKAEDGSVALSARVSVANLRSLHETSFGQTRHAPLTMLIPDADGCLQSREVTDKDKFDYSSWCTTGALPRLSSNKQFVIRTRPTRIVTFHMSIPTAQRRLRPQRIWM